LGYVLFYNDFLKLKLILAGGGKWINKFKNNFSDLNRTIW
jgi:hypothetical protein